MSQFTKAMLIEAVTDLAAKSGRQPSRKMFREAYPEMNRYWIDLLFESWTGLILEAGFDPLKKTKTVVKIQEEKAQKRTEQFQENLDALIEMPELPTDDIPVEEIIKQMSRRFEKRHEAHNAKKWMEFKVNSDLPIALCTFGDPHLDDDGCNWPLLLRDIELCKNTPGMYGMNIGDTTNNWVGRLIKEYANQETSRGTAFKLVEWFFKDSGIKWLVMLLGNHDSWNFGSETLSRICENVCIMVDWRAQFKLKFSNGRECLIDAAHDHTGHSQWNSLHAQQKASTMGGIAHVYIAGHKHNWALAQNECPHTHRVYWLARARGYKHIDHYGENLGFGSQKAGSSVVIVIDPKAPDVNMVRCFADVQEGADYLTWLRNKVK